MVPKMQAPRTQWFIDSQPVSGLMNSMPVRPETIGGALLDGARQGAFATDALPAEAKDASSAEAEAETDLEDSQAERDAKKNILRLR